MPISLPFPFLSEPVIPYAPNAPGDRGHTWDWPGHLETMPSGASIGTVDAAKGTETIALGYVGLSRAEVRTLEAIVEARSGRYEGFWCPTFQHEFHAVDGPHYGFSSIKNLVVRDWGFHDNIFPDAPQSRWLAAYHAGSWLLTKFTGASDDPGTFDETGARLVGYNLDYGAGIAGSAAVLDPSTPSDRANRMVCRLLWVRFADDAITTEWDHPHLANVTLRVQTLRLETPSTS